MQSNICSICSNPQKQYSKNHYAKTCGKKECINQLRKLTNIKKYGHVCNLHSAEGQNKIKETLKNRYGEHITNVSQLPDVKQAKKDTCLANFGVEHPMQSAIIMQKSQKTLLNKYGVDNISKLEETINKIQNTKNTPTSKYFGLTPLQFGIIKNKEYNLNKYGVEYYFQTETFKIQYANIMLEKYGDDNFFKTDKFHEMMIQQGLRYSNDDLANIENYKRMVAIFTERSYLEFKSILEKEFKRSRLYHLDHIYSISAGFKANIKPEIIGSICNLQMLPDVINMRKSDKCWITESELMTRYTALNIM